MPLLLHVLGKCLIKIPIIWQQSNKNNTPTQKVFKIFANINVNFAGSSQVVEAIPVSLPSHHSPSLSFVCTFIFAIKAKISALEMAKAKHTATTTTGSRSSRKARRSCRRGAGADRQAERQAGRQQTIRKKRGQ